MSRFYRNTGWGGGRDGGGVVYDHNNCEGPSMAPADSYQQGLIDVQARCPIMPASLEIVLHPFVSTLLPCTNIVTNNIIMLIMFSLWVLLVGYCMHVGVGWVGVSVRSPVCLSPAYSILCPSLLSTYIKSFTCMYM